MTSLLDSSPGLFGVAGPSITGQQQLELGLGPGRAPTLAQPPREPVMDLEQMSDIRGGGTPGVILSINRFTCG